MRPLILTLALTLIAVPAAADLFPFDSNAWTLQNGQVVEHLGRQSLRGSAFLADIAFENGVIAFDIAFDGSRGYPGITFRATSPVSYEHLYLRPHAGLRTDGLQYAPAFGPGSDWQLYNGPGYTTSLAMPPGRWIPVRVEILGRRARVFYDGAEEPVLVIDDLKHEPAAGAIGIRSAPNASAHFSEFRVTRTDNLTFPPLEEPLQPRGLVREWEVSQALRYVEHDAEHYPDAALLDALEWRTLPAEPDGLLNLSRHLERSPSGEPQLAYARVFLDAEAAESHPFSFGYSDYVAVFLDGEKLYTGNNAYQSRSPDFAGLVGLGDQLSLPLHAGRNELMFCVVETFGGWGLKGQDNDDDLVDGSLSEAWKLETGLRFPESAAYDRERDVIYVSNNLDGGREFISRVSPDGEVLDRRWATELARPTGLAVHAGRLWAVERSGLAEIDLDTGEVVARHPIPGAGFLNDICFDDQDIAYVSDTRGGRIFRRGDDGFAVWLEGLEGPNGLLSRDELLFYGSSPSGCVMSVRLDDPTPTVLACIGRGANVDGLASFGKGGIIASDYNGRVIRIGPGGAVTTLLDRTSSGTPTADLTYVPEHRLLVIPSLAGNSLTAYRIESW